MENDFQKRAIPGSEDASRVCMGAGANFLFVCS